MIRNNCFIEHCRFNNNMKCNAQFVSVKLRNNREGSAAGRVYCTHYRPLP